MKKGIPSSRVAHHRRLPTYVDPGGLPYLHPPSSSYPSDESVAAPAISGARRISRLHLLAVLLLRSGCDCIAPQKDSMERASSRTSPLSVISRLVFTCKMCGAEQHPTSLKEMRTRVV
mmetsp:Transcript_37726/g.78297  ORF Transcript_37726/g.78297 Transcript_37726/m.78297 type:complete len:118 (-) Transcript_37726:241-594(-)